jgi:hypothetical protein
MGLKLSKKSDIGVDGDYWRIISIETHYGGPNQVWPSKTAQPITYVNVAQYVSKAARDNKSMSMKVERFVLDGQSNGLPPEDPGYYKAPNYLPEPTRAAAYAAIKTLPFFQSAEDEV